MHRPMLHPMYRRPLAWLALLACGLPPAAGAATITALPSAPSNVITSGFENPGVSDQAKGFAYAPSGTNWTFSARTGIAANGSQLGNSAAPHGVQVGFLRTPTSATPSTLTRSFTLATPGRYRLSLQTARPSGSQQSASVRIDGNEVGRFTPAGSSFSLVVFDALQLNAGSHALTFTGLADSGDHTLFLDEVRVDAIAAGSRQWSDTTSWDSGTLPGSGDTVVIPVGSSVLLDGQHEARNVEVHGELHCDDADISLSTGAVLVMGRFVCGAPTSPYLHAFTLTLTCPASHATAPHDDFMGMGDKVVGAMGSGVIELHGEPRSSRSQLRQSAAAGTSVLHLSTATDWRIGDRVVVAPTRWTTQDGLTTDESEVFEIIDMVEGSSGGIKALGQNIYLDRLLAYPHYGDTKTYTNGAGDTSWTLDERAEVGLLNRNIVVQGDTASTADSYGGHMMSMDESSVHVSAVELRRMGQAARLGRYPFHWHLRGDAPGQYIANSSVHTSYNRCITVHGTNQVRVADNLCYDFVGHGYFLERGDEQFNVFDGNLGIRARRPAAVAQPDACVPPLETDFREALASNGPAVFWISNPNNTFTNNIAAGSQGAGFWYHLDKQLTCLPPAGQPQPAPMNPRYQPFGKFDNNRVYASRQGLTLCHDSGGTPGVSSPQALFENTTVSSVGQGIWPCADEWFRQNATFDGSIVANTQNGLQAPTPFTLTNSLFVAYTANTPALAQESAETPWAAVRMYDQGFIFDNIHFVNYHQRNMSAFLTINGAGKLTNNRTSRLSFANSPNIYRDLTEAAETGKSSEGWGMPIHDLDGSLAEAGTAVVPGHPLLIDAACRRTSGVDGYACPYRYAQFRFDYWPPMEEAGRKPPPYVTQMRSDGVSDSTAGMEGRYLVQVMADAPYYHSYRFDAGIPRNNLDLLLLNAHAGDTSVHQFLDILPAFAIHPAQAPFWQPVYSLADLQAGTGRQYLHDQASASLFVKMRAAGEDWHALDALSLCMVDFSLAGGTPTCPAGVPPPPPVRTRITSAERVADSLPITVTANVTTTAPGRLKVTLFLDDGTAFAPTGSAPFTFALGTRPPGTHVIKVVAKHTDLSGKVRSHTDVQRLIIGQPGQRLTLTSPAADGTYALGAVPALTYSFENGPTPGQHVRWYDNGTDMGPAVGSVSLAGLSLGRHDLEIALSHADGKIGSTGSRRTVYVTSGGGVADFEQGADTRIKLRPDRDESRIVRPFYATGLRATAYLDGGAAADDYNHYNTYYDVSDGLRESSFLLQITPAQDWSAYNAVEITHRGQGFEVWLTRGNAPDLLLTPTAAYLPVLATQIFAFGANDVSSVTGVELRQSVPAPAVPANCANVYNAPYCYVQNSISHLRLLTPNSW
jgi:cell surface hyaluronidase